MGLCPKPRSGLFGFPEMLEQNVVKRKHFRVSSALRIRKGFHPLTLYILYRNVIG